MILKDIYTSVTDTEVLKAARRYQLGHRTPADMDVLLSWLRSEVGKDKRQEPSALKRQASKVLEQVEASQPIPDLRYGDAITYLRTAVLSGPVVGEFQNFSPEQLYERTVDGLVTMTADEITWHTTPRLKFRILRRPGYYCCFDDMPMSDGAAAQAYIREHFPDKESPDPANPSGYRCDNFYACVTIEVEAPERGYLKHLFGGEA